MCFIINFSNERIGPIKAQGKVSRRTNRSNGRGREDGVGKMGVLLIHTIDMFSNIVK